MAVDASSISSADASAIIDGALFDAQSGGKAISGTSDNPILLPSGDTKDPIAPPPPEETEEEKKIRKAKEDLLGKEAADTLAKEEAEKAAREATLLGAAEKFLNRSKATASAMNIRIGNIPTPGNVGFPLVLLALFFFILITYNGNTRLQWVWQVLTNNAFISPSQGANSSPGTSGQLQGQTQTQQMPLSLPSPSFSTNGMGGNPYS